jgi:hypothetical protein
MGDQGSVSGKYVNFCINTYKPYLDPTSFVSDGYLELLNIQLLEHGTDYPSINSVEYSSPPVSVGDTFQDLPQMPETTDSSKPYI